MLHTTRSPRRALAVLCAVVALALLATTAPIAAAAGDGNGSTPARDFPQVPGHCYAARGDSAPRPEACPVTQPFKPHAPTLVVWGDSTAIQYLPPLRSAVKGRRLNLVAFLSGGCPPAWVPRREGYPNCEKKNRAALDWIKQRRDSGEGVTVLVGAYWTGYRQYYRRLKADEAAGRPPRYDDYHVHQLKLAHRGIPPMFDALGKLGVPVEVIGPSGAFDPAKAAPCAQGETPYRCALPRARVLQEEQKTHAYLARQMRKLAGTSHLIDTSPAYCTARECYGTVDGRPTFYDDAHLGMSFTSTLTRFFRPTAARAARRGNG